MLWVAMVEVALSSCRANLCDLPWGTACSMAVWACRVVPGGSTWPAECLYMLSCPSQDSHTFSLAMQPKSS